MLLAAIEHSKIALRHVELDHCGLTKEANANVPTPETDDASEAEIAAGAGGHASSEAATQDGIMLERSSSNASGFVGVINCEDGRWAACIRDINGDAWRSPSCSTATQAAQLRYVELQHRRYAHEHVATAKTTEPNSNTASDGRDGCSTAAGVIAGKLTIPEPNTLSTTITEAIPDVVMPGDEHLERSASNASGFTYVYRDHMCARQNVTWNARINERGGYILWSVKRCATAVAAARLRHSELKRRGMMPKRVSGVMPKRVSGGAIEDDELRLDSAEYVCEKCGQSFDNRFSFSSHLRTRCKQDGGGGTERAPKVEGPPVEVKSSERTIKRPDRFNDGLTGRSPSLGSVRKSPHVGATSEHGSGDMIYTCGTCDKQFANRFAYSAHRKRCRREADGEGMDSPTLAAQQSEYHCDKCGQLFSNRYAFSSHFHKKCVGGSGTNTPSPRPPSATPVPPLTYPQLSPEAAVDSDEVSPRTARIKKRTGVAQLGERLFDQPIEAARHRARAVARHEEEKWKGSLAEDHPNQEAMPGDDIDQLERCESNTSGFPECVLANAAYSNERVCSICQDTPSGPWPMPCCGTIFCLTCIQRHRHVGNDKCPTCRTVMPKTRSNPLATGTAKPNEAIAELFAENAALRQQLRQRPPPETANEPKQKRMVELVFHQEALQGGAPRDGDGLGNAGGSCHAAAAGVASLTAFKRSWAPVHSCITFPASPQQG